jgi:hypothetical protein
VSLVICVCVGRTRLFFLLLFYLFRLSVHILSGSSRFKVAARSSCILRCLSYIYIYIIEIVSTFFTHASVCNVCMYICMIGAITATIYVDILLVQYTSCKERKDEIFYTLLFFVVVINISKYDT